MGKRSGKVTKTRSKKEKVSKMEATRTLEQKKIKETEPRKTRMETKRRKKVQKRKRRDQKRRRKIEVQRTKLKVRKRKRRVHKRNGEPRRKLNRALVHLLKLISHV